MYHSAIRFGLLLLPSPELERPAHCERNFFKSKSFLQNACLLLLELLLGQDARIAQFAKTFQGLQTRSA